MGRDVKVCANVYIANEPEAGISVSGAECNAGIVMLRIGEICAAVDVYMTPEQARRAAAVLLDDADRCDRWHTDQIVTETATIRERSPQEEVVF